MVLSSGSHCTGSHLPTSCEYVMYTPLLSMPTLPPEGASDVAGLQCQLEVTTPSHSKCVQGTVQHCSKQRRGTQACLCMHTTQENISHWCLKLGRVWAQASRLRGSAWGCTLKQLLCIFE